MRILSLIILCFFFFTAYSQIGKDCNTPNIITTLPYSGSGLTTAGFGNDYTIPCPSCAVTSFMSGNDYVFQFIPTVNMNLTVRLTNTTAPAAAVGLFLVKGCPNDPSSQLVGMAEGASSGYPQILNKPVLKDSIYYIIVDTYNLMNFVPVTGFSIEVQEAFLIDLGGIMIFEPRTECGLTDTTRFSFIYRSYGSDTLSNIPIGFQVNNDPPVIENQPNPILPYVDYYYTFSTRYDLSAPNTTYTIKLFVAYPGDENPNNDTIMFNVSNHDLINTFPYFQDFETNSQGWNTEWIDQVHPGTSWQYGSPNKPVINHSASGLKCWVTDTIGTNLYDENSYVIGPCFDFTSITLPVLEMDVWYETKPSDIILVEYTTDRTPTPTVTWHRIGNQGEGQNWYNYSYQQNSAWNGSSGGWLHALHVLDNLGGLPYVKLRVKFIGGLNGLAEGFAFDNVKISESPMSDLSVEKIIYPVNDCGLSAVDSVKILVKNHGMNPQSDFIVKCSIDGGLTFVEDTVHQILNFQDTIEYMFRNSFDLSLPGIYNIVTAVVLPNDLNNANDSVTKQIMNYPVISLVPSNEDFENNNGYWYSSGLNNSWEWGIPNDSILTNAYSGQKCWATNLSGYHNLAEKSDVESPCFDLTQYKNPKIKMAVWYDQVYPTYCQFDTISIGSAFGYLGSATDPDWYNLGHAWNNSSNGWKEVAHDIKMFAGKPNVKFKFHFEGAVQRSGFAFDDIVVCDKPLADFTEDLSIKGYFVTLINGSTNMDSCLWDFGDGTFSNLSNPPNHNYPNSDSVLVTLYVYNSCGADSIKKYVHPKFVGVFSSDLDSHLKIYPNPVKDILRIDISDLLGEVRCEILNIQGTLVHSKTIEVKDNVSSQIHLEFLAKGIYFVKVKTNLGIIYRKIVKD